MLLSELAKALDIEPPAGADVEVTGVTHQADWAQPGDVFVAIRGAKADGHSFIDQALASGAVAVLGQGAPEGVEITAPYLRVDDARAALADVAAELYGHPGQAMTVIGVTGTDGKTTTTCLVRHLLRASGVRAGLLSTIGYERPDGVLRQPPTHFTTPEAPQVQQILREIADARGQAVVLEASSHALALDRVRGVDFDIGVWTNLTGEHLDFHGTMEGYFADKATLIERSRRAVLNLDDEWTPRLLELDTPATTYSADGNTAADWHASGIVEGPDDLRFTLHTPQGEFAAVLPMIGRFNVANALAALVAVHQAGVGSSAADIVTALASFGGVAGRMQMLDRGPSDPRVIVDFAHTPPSLEKALDTVRVTTEGRLWVVLGSAGGPRDPSKRAPLGEVATRKADVVVFTEEDHRDTPLADILAEMERGAREAGRDNFVSIGDRVEAIRHAVHTADASDTVVLAGKGPEATLERDTETIDWDEVDQGRQALQARRVG